MPTDCQGDGRTRVIGEDAFPEPLEVPAELVVYAVATWLLIAACLIVDQPRATGAALALWIALLVAGGDVP